jgi:hypothetical protein
MLEITEDQRACLRLQGYTGLTGNETRVRLPEVRGNAFCVGFAAIYAARAAATATAAAALTASLIGTRIEANGRLRLYAGPSPTFHSLEIRA